MLAKRWVIQAGLGLILAALALPGGAATVSGTPPALPPGAPTPGQVQSNLPSASQAPDTKSAPLTVTPPPTTAEIPSGGATVTVTGFDISGNTVFDTPTLQALVASYVGKDLTLAGLYNAAAVITRYYQDHGYGIARATLPEQKLSDGRVHILVLEGHIGKLRVEGNTRTRTGVILGQGAAVKSGDVFTDLAMDRAALLVNDLPALHSQAVLVPGDEFGTADVVYKVGEDPEYSGQVSVDDYGHPEVGRVRVTALANVASLTGSGDRLTAAVIHAEHDQVNYGGLNYNLPVGEGGGRLTASYDRSRYHVTGIFSPLHLAGTGQDGSLGYQYPWLRSRESSLFLGLNVQHQSGDATITVPETVLDPKTHKNVKQLVTLQVSSSNLNLLQFTAYYVHYYQDGSSYNLSGSLSTNGRHDDGNDPRAERAKLEVDAGYQLPFSQGWTFITRGSSVWSPDPLADTEKFSLGGPDNVRGFPSADVRGDAGFFGSLELQRSLAPGLPLSLGAFFDSGRTWSRHFDTPISGVDSLGKPFSAVRTTPPEVRTLESVGADLIYQSVDKRWEGRLIWAYAVGYAKPSDGNRGGHIWATLGMSF